MFLDLREIQRKGKTEQDFFYEYQTQDILIDIPSVEIQMPIKVLGKLTLAEKHSAYVSGQVQFSLVGDCTRCLKQTSINYVANFEEFVVENNQDGYSVVNDKIDLGKIVNDVILTNLPVNFLCDENCLGICLGCGVNLNNEACKCKN